MRLSGICLNSKLVGKRMLRTQEETNATSLVLNLSCLFCVDHPLSYRQTLKPIFLLYIAL